METALRTVNALISALFFICYAYQFLYIPLVLAKKQRPLPCPPSPHRYAVLIAARNESAVIGGLLDSLRQQTYDPALLTVFVAADNCTDSTAAIARAHGAVGFAYLERCADKRAALRREAALKKLSKPEKEVLCAAWRAAGCPGVETI